MKQARRRFTIASMALIFTFVLSASHSAQTNALSLSDVTNTLGNVLGINNNRNQETTQQQPSTSSNESAATIPAPSTDSSQSQLPVAQADQRVAQTVTPPSSGTISAPAVEAVQSVTPATTDTGAIARQVAAAQTSRSINPVEYSSTRISADFRDELYALAAVILLVGVSLYGMTYLGVARSVPAESRRPLYIK